MFFRFFIDFFWVVLIIMMRCFFSLSFSPLFLQPFVQFNNHNSRNKIITELYRREENHNFCSLSLYFSSFYALFHSIFFFHFQSNPFDFIFSLYYIRKKREESILLLLIYRLCLLLYYIFSLAINLVLLLLN